MPSKRRSFGIVKARINPKQEEEKKVEGGAEGDVSVDLKASVHGEVKDEQQEELIKKGAEELRKVYSDCPLAVCLVAISRHNAKLCHGWTQLKFELAFDQKEVNNAHRSLQYLRRKDADVTNMLISETDRNAKRYIRLKKLFGGGKFLNQTYFNHFETTISVADLIARQKKVDEVEMEKVNEDLKILFDEKKMWPQEFEGKTVQDYNPTNDATIEAANKLFLEGALMRRVQAPGGSKYSEKYAESLERNNCFMLLSGDIGRQILRSDRDGCILQFPFIGTKFNGIAKKLAEAETDEERADLIEERINDFADAKLEDKIIWSALSYILNAEENAKILYESKKQEILALKVKYMQEKDDLMGDEELTRVSSEKEDEILIRVNELESVIGAYLGMFHHTLLGVLNDKDWDYSEAEKAVVKYVMPSMAEKMEHALTMLEILRQSKTTIDEYNGLKSSFRDNKYLTEKELLLLKGWSKQENTSDQDNLDLVRLGIDCSKTFEEKCSTEYAAYKLVADGTSKIWPKSFWEQEAYCTCKIMDTIPKDWVEHLEVKKGVPMLEELCTKICSNDPKHKMFVMTEKLTWLNQPPWPQALKGKTSIMATIASQCTAFKRTREQAGLDNDDNMQAMQMIRRRANENARQKKP